MALLDQLEQICRAHILSSREALHIRGPREPYIPFIPANGDPAKWNRVLVLAEAQNLSDTNADYLESLEKATKSERIRRLHWGPVLHVGPWDDGTLKLAMCSAFGSAAELFAVSNAVLWSSVNGPRRNQTPGLVLRARSAAVWKAMLPIIDPACVVTTGEVARELIAGTKSELHASWLHVPLSSASRLLLARRAANFNEASLLRRSRKVADVVRAHPEYVVTYRRNKLYFASVAVSEVDKLPARF